ncbi:MAG: phosphoglycerate dehydrogenase-like enzyme [Oceanicoccus sp.]|jgi:phosphoglycerate dehydrogenase-like enzyme
MKNLLIAASAAERLALPLAHFSNKMNLFEMLSDGSVTHHGKPVSLAEIDIHCGWLSSDIMAANLTRDFAVTLLKSSTLEWVQSLSAGLDDPFFTKLAEKGIRLSNSDAQAPAIAEYVIGSVLHRYQDFETRRKYQNDTTWRGTDFREINNSNWMIVGLGNIGRLVADRVTAFGGNTIGVKRDPSRANDYSLIGFDNINAHLAQQDVVVLACALTADTRDMVDHAFLAQMKSDAILVNIGRGDLVKEDDLLNALDRDAIDFAVLDVFRTEPLPEDSQFWKHPRVLLTPHSSNRGLGTGPRGDSLFLANLDAFLNNKTLKNEVNTAELRLA